MKAKQKMAFWLCTMCFPLLVLFSIDGFGQDVPKCNFSKTASLVVLPQIHWTGEKKDENPKKVDGVAPSQYQIARSIIENPGRAVFLESVPNDVTPEKREWPDRKVKAQEIKKLFPNGVPDSYSQLNQAQRETLAKNGAVSILWYLGVIDTIHRTYESVAEGTEVEEEIKAIVVKYAGNVSAVAEYNKELNKVMYEKRERLALIQVDKFFNKHISTSAFLVFGGNHGFSIFQRTDLERANCSGRDAPGTAKGVDSGKVEIQSTSASPDCDIEIASSKLVQILEKKDNRYSINRIASGIKNLEKDGPNSYKIQFVDSGDGVRYNSYINFSTDGKIDTFLVQSMKLELMSECRSKPREQVDTLSKDLGTKAATKAVQ
jgi:hypothetical protein